VKLLIVVIAAVLLLYWLHRERDEPLPPVLEDDADWLHEFRVVARAA
jgi:hypothetical protein